MILASLMINQGVGPMSPGCKSHDTHFYCTFIPYPKQRSIITMLWDLATAHTHTKESLHTHAQFTGETTPHNTLPNHHIDLATKTLAALLSLSLSLPLTHAWRARTISDDGRRGGRLESRLSCTPWQRPFPARLCC